MHISIDTVLPADSVEFCPHPDASNIFVCGTYKLEDKQNDQGVSQPPAGQIRKGQCLVFEVHPEHSEDISVYAVLLSARKVVIEGASAPRLKIYPSLLSWILNGENICLFRGRWRVGAVRRCHTEQNRQPLLAVADAEGNMNLFEWSLQQVSYSRLSGSSLLSYSSA